MSGYRNFFQVEWGKPIRMLAYDSGDKAEWFAYSSRKWIPRTVSDKKRFLGMNSTIKGYNNIGLYIMNERVRNG